MGSSTRAAKFGAVAVVGAALWAAPNASAAGLDSAFGTGGVALTPLSADFSDRYQASVAGPDGSTYSVGYTTLADGVDRAFALTKVKRDGTLDTSFGVGGVATVNVVKGPFAAAPNAPSGAAQAGPSGAGEGAQNVVVQADGKIVVVGQAETPPSVVGTGVGKKADSRDTDIYAVRFQANGKLDKSYGGSGSGIARIDLSDGIRTAAAGAATTAVNGDKAYGLSIRPDGRTLITGAIGVDSATNTTRDDSDLAVVSLTTSGERDATFGTNGVAVARTPDVSESIRQGFVAANGDFVTSAYGNKTGQSTRPILYRFKSNGTLDPAFGGDATFNTPGIAAPTVPAVASRAEAYGVVESGGKLYVSGYGSRAVSTGNTDATISRYNADGTVDATFGEGGIVLWDAGLAGGGADRARNIKVLSDGRIVTAGGTTTRLAVPAAGTTPAQPAVTKGLVLVLNQDGTFDSRFGDNGAIKVDFGGPADFLYGAAVDGTVLTASGYLGGSNTADDDAGIARIDLTPAAAPGPGTTPTTPVTAPSIPVVPTPTVPSAVAPVAKPSKSAGKVTVTCDRIGRKRTQIRCVVKQANVASGTVRLSLTKKGKKTLSGSAKTSKGKATVTIKASRAKATYKVTLKLPTPAGTVQTITRSVVLR